MKEQEREGLAESEQSANAGLSLAENFEKHPIKTMPSSEEKAEKKAKKIQDIKKRFSAKRLALMAIFVALSFCVSLLEFPIFPATPFLELDFGNVFIMLIGFLLGPVEGVLVCAVKESLSLLGPNSNPVGQLANIIMTSAYILLPSIIYRKYKGMDVALFSLAGACVIATTVSLMVNHILFPMYMGESGEQLFYDAFWLIALFNIIKTVSISVLTVLLYKRLSNFLKKIKI
ncbi:MAG: ECF transporter S component [Clostridia bacterium]|nr:ECF transporter S component [Clostridia bacterium]